MESDPVIFNHTAEGLFLRILAPELTPKLRDELKTLGLDLSKTLMPAYPVPAWNRIIEATARALMPDLPLPASSRRIGERMLEGYNQTLIGQAVIALARVIGPARALKRTRQNWRSGNNYTEVEVTELGPADFRLEFNETGVSRWVSEGLLFAGLQFTGARDLMVKIEGFTDTHATYRVTWSR